jgi:hypothetical protein
MIELELANFVAEIKAGFLEYAGKSWGRSARSENQTSKSDSPKRKE